MEKLNTTLKVAAVGLGVSMLMLTAGCQTTGSGSSSNMSYASTPKPRPAYHFASTRPATGNEVFIFDPQQYAWAAYDAKGQLIRTGIASGGADYCPDIKSGCRTPVGTFRVYREGGPDCKSSKFPLGKGGAPMPHCGFFNGGYAVHGSYDVPAYNASHGCIRVTPGDAAWLDNNVLNVGTTVIVRSY
jgi:hypothetical protein